MSEHDAQQIPSHYVPYPSSISEEARAALKFWAGIPASNNPALDDHKGWLERASRSDAGLKTFLGERFRRALEKTNSCPIVLGGVPCYFAQPTTGSDHQQIVIDIHGGGFTSGAGEACEMYGVLAAHAFKASVYAIDYRMPPKWPYPAALDDCILAYRAIIQRHSSSTIVVRGISAGGNLAAALMLRLRNEGLPLPAALLLITPELDLTESGDSFQTNAFVDVVLKGSLMQANLLYANGEDLRHPYLSPMFGDLSAGFPPTLLVAGTRDLFLSNAARMNNILRRSGNYSELIIEEAMPHGGFFGAPEDDALAEDIRDFALRAWAGRLPARWSGDAPSEQE